MKNREFQSIWKFCLVWKAPNFFFFFLHRATTVIVGSFVGRTYKNQSNCIPGQLSYCAVFKVHVSLTKVTAGHIL